MLRIVIWRVDFVVCLRHRRAPLYLHYGIVRLSNYYIHTTTNNQAIIGLVYNFSVGRPHPTCTIVLMLTVDFSTAPLVYRSFARLMSECLAGTTLTADLRRCSA